MSGYFCGILPKKYFFHNFLAFGFYINIFAFDLLLEKFINMRKISIILIIILLGSVSIYAQPKIEKSVPIDEPTEGGWSKVLQLKNGNTFFFHFTKKEGIEVTVFDKTRKITADKTITSEVWDPKKMRGTAILGLYEINNEPVLFMAQADGRVPTLYRLRFNGATGDLVKEEEIGSLPKVKLISFSAEGNNIFIEKDPQSDCYAVIFFNGYASDRDERIKIIHYDGNHKVINLAYYESPDESYKYLRYIGAVVDGNKRVFISTYGAASLRGKDAHVYISRLNAGDSTFTNKTLDFTEDFKDTKSVMTYNHVSNTIELLTLSFATGKPNWFTAGGTNYYVSFISFIDPEALQLKSVKPLLGEKINEYAHNTLQLKLDYHGLPQQMIINKDNSITVLSEEMTKEVVQNQQGEVVSANTYLGAIGMSELNEDGTEKNGFVIIKMQMAGGLFKELYISDRSKGRWAFLPGAAEYNAYISYDYINTDKNRYIIFNDNPKNFDKDEDQRKRKMVVNINKLNTICYSLNGSVDKSYLFGNPEDKDQSFSCMIESSDYMKSTNSYATVLIERNGHDREAKLVWITFD